MNQQKGFSLTEVLASLLLVSTLALVLLQQQWQSKQLLNQIVLRAQGTLFLDQIDETLSGQVKKLPSTPSSYQLDIKHNNQELFINLVWFDKAGSITRKRSFIGQQ